jgi:hypothetical protein
MKRKVLLAGVLLAASTAAQLPEAWRNWQYSAPITTKLQQGRLVGVEVTARIAARTQRTAADLRVIDEQGQEVPYILYARREKRTKEWRDARLLELTYKPGESTQGIVDIGENPRIHNSIEILSSEADFFAWVELSISSDARRWRILRERAPIYRFRRDTLEGNQAILYPPSYSRYLRVRILEPGRRFALDGVRVAHEVVEEAERQPLDAILRRDLSSPTQQTWWLADLGEAQPFVSQAGFEVAESEFYRAIRISASDDAKAWRTAGSGDIYRIKVVERAKAPTPETQEQVRERLKVTFPETQARYWRVEVLDRNDPALVGVRVRLFTTPRRVVFRAEAGRRYRLLYGNSRADAPQYNLARIVDAKSLESAEPARLGAEEGNASYADPAPWSERHPIVLWAALAIAVLALGALAVRALRSAH